MHVVGLDVAVNDFLRMDVLERARQLERDPQTVSRVAHRAVLNRVAQVLAFEKLHDHERAAFSVFTEIVNTDDVVVTDVAGQLRFLQKARLRLRVGAAFLGQDLDGYDTPDDGVPRPVDARHAAAEEFLQFVFANACGKLHGHQRATVETHAMLARYPRWNTGGAPPISNSNRTVAAMRPVRPVFTFHSSPLMEPVVCQFSVSSKN